MTEDTRLAETVDVADIVRTMRRQWRAFAAFLFIGVFGALAVVLFAPRRYAGKASVLARAGAAGGSILGRLGTGGTGDLLSNVTGLGGNRTEFETELQVLKSRELAGRLVDSLQLQFATREPRGVSPRRYIVASDISTLFEPRTYRFEVAGNGHYRARLGDSTWDLIQGQPSHLDIGSLTLATGSLPPRFALKVFDREDAITRVISRFTINKAGGDVAKIVYSGDDSLSAAAVPNALVGFYLERRRTTDRSVNQRRMEYVASQIDSTIAQLAVAERELRRHQEATGVLDATLTGTADGEELAVMRKAVVDVEVDAAAVSQLLKQYDAGTLTPRQLAAYPVFIRGSSISPLVSQLTERDAQRRQLLERRTEKDPEVIALDQSMKLIEDQIVALVRSYAGAVNRQRDEMSRQLDSLKRRVAVLPAAAERGGQLYRQITRNSAILGALQAQLVEARLAVIGEGGELKQLDAAAVPRKPSFPDPVVTLGLGTAGGVVFGAIAALIMGWFGRWLRDPDEVERIAGVAAQRLLPDTPLFVLGTGSARSVLVVPLDDGVGTALVAERLARTALARSVPAVVIDLSGSSISGGNGAQPTSPVAAIQALERDHGMVVARLPALASEVTFAALGETRPVVLVAPHVVNRARLASALEMLRRMAVPCAGVVIGDGTPSPARVRAFT